MVINLPNDAANSAAESGTGAPMRTISFILAFAFVLAGQSIAGSSETNLPGVGTFAYMGAPIAAYAPQATLIASR